jgi:hypothetical protein
MPSSPVLKGYEWIQIEEGRGLRLRCDHCGHVHQFWAPITVRALPFAIRAFQEQHTFCQPGSLCTLEVR